MKTNPEGMVQYFYHSPHSLLPIRDVLNIQGMGHKHEPHIEAGAENLLDSCYQANIARFARSQREYLFLLTRCANPNLTEHYGKQQIVGYIRRRETGKIQGRTFIRGDTKLFDFSDSVAVIEIFGWNFNRPRLISQPDVDQEKTARILGLLSGKRNRLEECIHEIDITDFAGITCHPDICGFSDSCSRYAVYRTSDKESAKKPCEKK